MQVASGVVERGGEADLCSRKPHEAVATAGREADWMAYSRLKSLMRLSVSRSAKTA